MNNYLLLQFKRVLKVFPLFFLISAIFFAGLSAVYFGFLNMDKNSEKNQKFKFAISGDPGEEYLDMAMAALQSVDSSRFTLEIVYLDEAEAEKQLQKGKISAYAVFPEDFINNALKGVISPIKFVTTKTSTNLISMFKDELTTAVSDIMTESQSGTYGVYDALKDNGHKDLASKHINKIGIKYVDVILERSGVYEVQELGVENGVNLPFYLFCSITVLYVCIMVIPFAHLYIKKDNSLITLLYSQGFSVTKQVLAEYTAFCSMILFVFLIIIGGLNGILNILLNLEMKNFVFDIPLVQIAKYILPIILVTSSLGFFVYEFSDGLISGILTQFFISIFLCYASGCIYPTYMLPTSLQYFAKISPFGAARSFLTSGVEYEFDFIKLVILIAYSVCFVLLSILVRRYKIIARSNK